MIWLVQEIRKPNYSDHVISHLDYLMINLQETVAFNNWTLTGVGYRYEIFDRIVRQFVLILFWWRVMLVSIERLPRPGMNQACWPGESRWRKSSEAPKTYSRDLLVKEILPNIPLQSWKSVQNYTRINRLDPVLKTIFHQCALSYTCS